MSTPSGENPSRFEAHPFQEPDGGGEPELCALCGERRSQILHHPTRIRAASMLHAAQDAEEEDGDSAASGE